MTEKMQSKISKKSTSQMGIIFGCIILFVASTAIGYYFGWAHTWADRRNRPLIGKAPLTLQLVKVVKAVPAQSEIQYENVEEVRQQMPAVSGDFVGFAADCMGRQVKWTLPKGSYVTKHDLMPRLKDAPKSAPEPQAK